MAIRMKDLFEIMPQVGQIEWMSIRPVKRGEVQPIAEIEVTVEAGLLGDHYGKEGGKRMVTLIQKEHIDVVESIMKTEVDPKMLRRNIIVSGINLLALKEKVLQIGDEVQLEVTGICHPCSRMETNLGPGGYNAMRGHGGITAKVLQGGTIRVGDPVKMVTH
jgi:MOSC domain-containing protein YiiM